MLIQQKNFVKTRDKLKMNSSVSYPRPSENTIEVDNTPYSGFKLINNGILDPRTGIQFRLVNYYVFMEYLVKNDLIRNGVITVPVILVNNLDSIYAKVYNEKDLIAENEYPKPILNGDELEIEQGNMIYDTKNDSWKIYLGRLYYIERSGKKLSIKRLYVCDEYSKRLSHNMQESEISTDTFINSYNSYSFPTVKLMTPADFKRDNYYILSRENIANRILNETKKGKESVAAFIKDGEFDANRYVIEHGYINTSFRIAVDPNKIKKRNKIKLGMEEINFTTITLKAEYDYNPALVYVDVNHTILIDGNPLDMKKTYAVEINGEKFFMQAGYQSMPTSYDFKIRKPGIDDTVMELYFYKMDDLGFSGNSSYSYGSRQQITIEEFRNVEIKLFEVFYEINEGYRVPIWNVNSKIRVSWQYSYRQSIKNEIAANPEGYEWEVYSK